MCAWWWIALSCVLGIKSYALVALQFANKWESNILRFHGRIQHVLEFSQQSSTMQAHLDPTFVLYPKTFTVLLWSCIIKYWLPTIHVSTDDSSSILVLTTAILFWGLNCAVHTLTQDTATSWHISCCCLLLMTLGVSQVPCICHPMSGDITWDSFCFSPVLLVWESLPLSSQYHPPQVENYSWDGPQVGLIPCCYGTLLICVFGSLDKEF